MDERQILDELNKGALLSGRLSETHVKNLKLFPFVVFDHVDSAEIDYDIVTDPGEIAAGKKSKIVYRISLNEPQQGDVEKRVAALANFVRGLMWAGIEVSVELTQPQPEGSDV
jgi:hypothetical protein